jgi:SPP1 family predicted phage head-tail adaptor
MNPGELNRWIDLQRSAAATGTGGGVTYTGTTYARVKARFEGLRGAELIHAERVGSTAACKWTIRWRPDVQIGDWINHRGVTFEINAIENVALAGRIAVLYCTQRS